MTSLQSQSQRKNGLEQAARAFPNLNKVTPENKKKIIHLGSAPPPAPPQPVLDNIHPMENATTSEMQPNPNSINRKRFKILKSIIVLIVTNNNLTVL